MTADHLAFLTDGFHAWSYFHRSRLNPCFRYTGATSPRRADAQMAAALMCNELLVSIGDAASGEVVGSELHLNPITGQDADVVHTHLPGNMGQHLVPVLEFDAEHGVRQRLGHSPFQDDRVFFGLRQRALPTTCLSCRLIGSVRANADVLQRRRETLASCAPHSNSAPQPGRVKISGPSSVTAMECSQWADNAPSAVTTPQSSSRR